MAGTLGSRLATRDEQRFVGRTEELSLADRLFGADPPASVLHIHGPGGIGKSTLLRQIARRGEAAGWIPRAIDGRDLPPVPDALESALADVREVERPLVLFDTYERISAVDGFLRRGLLPSLPESAIVIIAGRKPPDVAWFQDGWENLTLAVELSGLSDAEALELLAGQGLADHARAQEMVAWAKGSPLALAVAADTVAAGSNGVGPDDDPEMLRALIRRLADSEVAGANLAALGVAAIARVTTPGLLRDVLDDGEAAAGAYEWLRGRTFAEPLGEGVTVHDLVRTAVRAEIRQREPEREREVRRRIADHLHARAVQGRLILSIELAHLVDDPVIRWGYSWEGSGTYRIDDLRPGDAAELAARLDERDGAWWESARPFVEGAPERVAVARDAEDRLAGYMIAVTPRNAPAFAEEDPLLGPRLAHARELSAEGNAVLWHDSIDLSGDPLPRVQAMLGMAGILRSGLGNPRYAYLPVNPRLQGAVEFSAALGARHLSELDLHVGCHTIECHLLDYGPGGLLGMQRDVVYRECGFPPPGERVADPIVAEQVREALRNLGVPHELARSELAHGSTPEERAASVRDLVERAADAAFGDTPNERLLHDVLVRGYLEPAPSHELAAEHLNLSRATYFRRLKAAAERVADHIAAGR